MEVGNSGLGGEGDKLKERMRTKQIYVDVEVNDTVEAAVDVNKIMKQLDDSDLKDELKKRGSKPPLLPSNYYGSQHIIDWFENPFISDFDKIQVPNKINSDYILEVEFIKDSL